MASLSFKAQAWLTGSLSYFSEARNETIQCNSNWGGHQC